MSSERTVRSTDRTPWSVSTLWVAILVGSALAFSWVWMNTEIASEFLVGVVGGFVAVSGVVGWLVWSVDDQPLTLATAITLVRGVALAVFVGVLAGGVPGGSMAWLPAVLFAIAAGLDAVDGWIARATDSVSTFGARLDTEMDGLTVLSGTLVVVVEALVPAVFLIVGVARYLFVFGIWLRKRRERPVAALPPSQLRRVLGGLAMATIWVALLPVVSATISRPVALVVLVPFVLNFTRDWLAVSGWHW